MPIRNYNTAFFVTAVRQLTNMETDPIITDPEIQDRCTEAKSALNDILVGTYEHYQLKTLDFTLAGGISGSSVALPTDFYKDISLDRNPTSQPQTVHRYGSWIERNSLPRRSYTIMGSNLVVGPPQLSSGNYRFSYTPMVTSMAEPTVVPWHAATTIPITVQSNDLVTASPNAAWVFHAPASVFNTAYIGTQLVITGSVSNNGTSNITGLPLGPHSLGVDGSHSGEVVGASPVVANVSIQDGVWSYQGGGVNLWIQQGANLDSSLVGTNVTVSGTSLNNGTFTIATVVSPISFTTTQATSLETFPISASMTYQQPGTADVLEQIYQPWYEYIQVHAAIAIKDKIEQDTSDLEARLERLTKRITSIAANRMEEGGQIALPGGLGAGGFWDETFPWSQ